MYEWASLHTMALVSVALQFGGMAYFAFIFTPMVFKFLDTNEASLFLRKVFPGYYRLNAAIAIAPALFLIPEPSFHIEVGTMLAVAATFLFSGRVIVPMANTARDASNVKKFKNIHRISVLIYVAQFIAVLVILIRLG